MSIAPKGMDWAFGSGPHVDPASLIGPADSWVIDGLDWAWAFVVYANVPEFPGYCIGTNGTLWSRRGNQYQPLLDRWRRCRGEVTRDGYTRVGLVVDGKMKKFLLHDLVLMAFVGPCPAGMQCRHLNGNPANNRPTNLRWGTPAENASDKYRHGTIPLGSQIGHSKLTEEAVAEIHRRVASGETYRTIARDYGVHESRISYIMHGREWRHVAVDGEASELVGIDRRIGSRSRHAKLNEQDVIQIRKWAREGFTHKQIAAFFGINPATVTRIVNRENWAHVPD